MVLLVYWVRFFCWFSAVLLLFFVVLPLLLTLFSLDIFGVVFLFFFDVVLRLFCHGSLDIFNVLFLRSSPAFFGVILLLFLAWFFCHFVMVLLMNLGLSWRGSSARFGVVLLLFLAWFSWYIEWGSSADLVRFSCCILWFSHYFWRCFLLIYLAWFSYFFWRGSSVILSWFSWYI